MDGHTPFNRDEVVKNTALMVGWVLVIGLVLRALVAQAIDPPATIIGGACALLLFSVYRRVKQGAPSDIGAMVVLAVVMVLYTALSWTSHGFRGSIIFVAPMIPLVAGLMLGKRAARLVTILLAIILLFILTQHLVGTLRPDEQFPEETRYAMRAIIMLLSLVGVNWIVSYYTMVAGVVSHLHEETRDPLTDLLSRQVIDEALERELARSHRAAGSVSLAIAEIDNLSGLAGDYGESGVDACIAGVADGMRYCLRRSSDALGRYGSNQLCILMSDTSSSGARRVGEKFRSLIETLDIPINGDRVVRVTVSVGACTAASALGADAEAVRAGAELALETSRANGGNVVEAVELQADGTQPP